MLLDMIPTSHKSAFVHSVSYCGAAICPGVGSNPDSSPRIRCASFAFARPVCTGVTEYRNDAAPIDRSIWRPCQLRRFSEAGQREVFQDFKIVDAEVVETARRQLGLQQ